MSLLDQISLWLQHNDLVVKLLAVLATPGGIWFWIDKYRNRVRIRIRKLNLASGDTSVRRIAFEAENVSSVLTSLEPMFLLTGYSPERKKQTYQFTIEGNERQLPAYVLRQVVAGHNDKENRIMLCLWYMTFTVPLTRGGRVRVHIRNAEFKPIGLLRFHWERMCFLFLGKVPDKAL
jgi:hypothetical protein